jgi:hypothetical protein
VLPEAHLRRRRQKLARRGPDSGRSITDQVAPIPAYEGRGDLWGALVMSAFDLYRGDLCKKLGLKMPPTISEEREMWTLMSQVMGYRSKEVADRVSRFREGD